MEVTTTGLAGGRRGRIGVVVLVVAALTAWTPAAAQSTTEPSNVFAFGDATFAGSDTGLSVNGVSVGLTPTPTGAGYWTAASDGGVFSFGDATFRGSAGNIRLVAPVVGIAATPSGAGYWLVAADGGVFAYGDAPFLGSMGDRRLNRPVVGMAATPDGEGYWLVADDGGVFAFGTARFVGALPPAPLRQRVVGIAAAADGGGYWLAARDGGVFSFGSAAFRGSAAPLPLRRPVSGIAADPDGDGYWLVARDGGVFAFAAPFLGVPSRQDLDRQVASVVAIAASPSGAGYWVHGTHLVGEQQVWFGRAGADCGAVSPVLRRIGLDASSDRIAALLEGPTPEERALGATSPFSLETAGRLQARRVVDRVAHIDLDDLSVVIPNASTSCGTAALLAQLDATVIGEDTTIDRVVYSFDGDVGAFYRWLQLTPPP